MSTLEQVENLEEFKQSLLYDNDGSDTGASITNYKPPRPPYFRKGTRTIGGYTQFQDEICSDCIIEFTAVFPIKGDYDAQTEENIDKFLKFRKNYSQRFRFIDEFGTVFKGYIQDKFDIDTPVEGDIYYISISLLCNHDVSGWTSDDSSL